MRSRVEAARIHHPSTATATQHLDDELHNVSNRKSYISHHVMLNRCGVPLWVNETTNQEREKREREQAKIQAVEDEKKALKDEEDRLRAIAKQAKAGREAHKKEMRRRKKVRGDVARRCGWRPRGALSGDGLGSQGVASYLTIR